jgi:glutathione S-transferase
MANPTLVIGPKNTSSWSLRPWILLKQAGIPFQELNLDYKVPSFKQEILTYSPAGKVPVLVDGPTKIWESLAICEYVAETNPRLWPEDRATRAHARSVSNEMHAGFGSLRQAMPMNFKGEGLTASWDEGVDRDIRRILQMWSDCRERYHVSGPFLFGPFSIADAMFAPVVSRFRTYGIYLTGLARTYYETMWALPAMAEWFSGAKAA